MTNYRDLEQRLSETLDLRRRPVAVVFRASPPAGVAKFEGSQPSGCSFRRLATGGVGAQASLLGRPTCMALPASLA